MINLYPTLLKQAGTTLVNLSIENARTPLPLELILEIRRILAGLVLFMLAFDLILTFVFIGVIYLHRRHIRKAAAEEGLTVTFKPRGPELYKIYCVFFFVYLSIFVIGTVLTLAGLFPIQLSQSTEEILGNIVLIFMLILIVGVWPSLMVAGFVIDIRDQRAALHLARKVKSK